MEVLLSGALGAIGSGLDERRVEGRSESFIRGRLRGTEVEVFIYNDEAQLQGPGVDQRFEAPDYPSGEALAQAFIDHAVACARMSRVNGRGHRYHRTPNYRIQPSAFGRG